MSDKLTKDPDGNKLKVIFCEPDKMAKVIEIEDKLEKMQELVGGMIEEYMPFEDDVALICNDEGKMMGMPLNRTIRDENGKAQDIIAGNFFICYAPIESENFLSLPPDLEKKYKAIFDYPEQFFRVDGVIEGVNFDPKPPKEQRVSAR